MSEYHEFAAKVDELNEVGSAYDASLKGVEISSTPMTRSTSTLCAFAQKVTAYLSLRKN